MRRVMLPLLFGLFGVTVLVSLGVWQLERLAWKTGILNRIESRIAATPAPLPAHPDPTADAYVPVRVTGHTTGQELDVLTSGGEAGPGFRVISAFETDAGRKIMVDEGFVPEADKAAPRPPVGMTVTGNLLWPDEVDGFTPPPDTKGNIWFARAVGPMAKALGTEPVLVVARQISGTVPRATPMPVDTKGIPNNHLGYAIQWFGMALVWAGMTAFWIWRRRRETG